MYSENLAVEQPKIDSIDLELVKKFAFLIHFRFGYRSDMGQFWKPLNKVSDNFYRKVFNKMKKQSFKWSEIYLNEEGIENDLLGITEMLMMSSEDMIKSGAKATSFKINSIIDDLVDRGYTNIGLGALTSPLTKGGLLLSERKDVSITNGNAFTAVSMYNGMVKLIEKNNSLIEHQTIVGATGSVGSCVAKMLVKHNYATNLQLIARNTEKLEELKKELNAISPSVKIEISADMKDIKKSNLIVLLTASADNLIKKEMLKKDAFILDGTQPRNTSEKLLIERPDLTIVDGGIVNIPGITLKKGKLDLPENNYYACFSETLLLALEGYKEHFSVGNPTLDQAEYIHQLAKKHKKYGFHLADFTSFGNPIII
ncbi:shikimate dehydrogenase [Marivirga salinae]|uniref:Shikimate dehydrogenase n=1 Tax=Marivirga salinarum TaxID=3059078 RepID=A0AA51RAF7_9BACT|nr:shikimate dehydrogenase [Marivirga sp. BDSF4-3]WMN11086.1 shikimate dehydrogenase [Marivirga sp. BDSF4-3]